MKLFLSFTLLATGLTAAACGGITSTREKAGPAGTAGAGSANSAGGTLDPGSGGATGVGAADGKAAGGSAGSAGAGRPIIGTEKFTLRTTPFTVNPGEEKFMCQNFANPFPGDVGIVKSESVMTPLSHHMFVFQGGSGTDGQVQECAGIEFSPYVHSAQTPKQSITYPEGIGRSIRKSGGLRVAMHYLNTSRAPISAEVSIDFYAVSPDKLQHLADSLFMNTLNVSIAPRSSGQATSRCTIPRDINLLGAVSHMHRHATHVQAVTTDGVTVYEGTDWDEPPFRDFEPPLAVKAGTEITTTCDYKNDTDRPLTFGESAETNEMCILSGVFYPAASGPITCLF